MADATVSRLGQVLASGDAKAMFEELYAGEVITAFETSVIMADKHLVRNLPHGKSATFPFVWKASGGYHTPGTEITGRVIKHNEKLISIDDVLLSDAFIANIDEAMNHYEVRSIYSAEQGRFLAKAYDQNVSRNVILAARDVAVFTGESYAGGNVTNAALTTSGSVIAESIWAAAQGLDEKDIPDADRFAVLRVAPFYLVAQNTNVMNRDWGGEGSYAGANVGRIANIPVFKSNNFPGDDRANADIPSGYRADFSVTQGMVFHKGAAGTVKLLDLALESGYDMRRQGTLMIAKYAVGHGKLNPACAYELRTAAPAA